MSPEKPLTFDLATSCLTLIAREAYWDSAVFNTRVMQIDHLEVGNPHSAIVDYGHFRAWVERERIGIISCRLAEHNLRESAFLEANNFRFIEMILHPSIDGLQRQKITADNLEISPANEVDLKDLRLIAETAFGHERYHIDPRIDRKLADKRYGQWVSDSLNHKTQRLLKARDGERLIGLFVVEPKSRLEMYWHLTAISPIWQGFGYGHRVWLSMLRYHQAEGYDAVRTTISARNYRVLNLYAKLGFRFMPPEITFHWVRESA